MSWNGRDTVCPLDYKNGLTKDALVDPGAYVSAIDQKDLDIIK